MFIQFFKRLKRIDKGIMQNYVERRGFLDYCIFPIPFFVVHKSDREKVRLRVGVRGLVELKPQDREREKEGDAMVSAICMYIQ